jgi:hypothetical protein
MREWTSSAKSTRPRSRNTSCNSATASVSTETAASTACHCELGETGRASCEIAPGIRCRHFRRAERVRTAVIACAGRRFWSGADRRSSSNSPDALTARRGTIEFAKEGDLRATSAGNAPRNWPSSSRISRCSDASTSLRRFALRCAAAIDRAVPASGRSAAAPFENRCRDAEEDTPDPGGHSPDVPSVFRAASRYKSSAFSEISGMAPKRASHGMRRVMAAHNASMVSMRSRAGFCSRSHPSCRSCSRTLREI